ncbi:MAG: ABC transporter permease [Ruminococcaceae bacterium]|nr:ABC transporter permease [Oscillospiraceae bacterium]
MYENESFSARVKAFFSRWGRLLLKSKTGLLGFIIVMAFLIIAVFAPQLAGHDPAALNPGNMTTSPFWMEGGSMEFPLGTDNLGRCILCRIMYGTRVSMLIGVCSVIVAGIIGTLFGLVAGYYGGICDSIIMRITDAFHAIPRTLLAMVLISAVSGGIPTLVFVIGFTGWIQYARLIRSEVLSLKNREFVKAAVTIGTPNSTIIRRHIIPNVMSSFIVVSTLAVASSIIAETSLSFLGLGIQAPQVSWGGMLSDGRNYLATHWWIATFPGIAITLAVLGIMFLGNWIRDVLDPHNQGLQ